MIDYWYRVDPGKCKLVYSHFYAPDGFQSFPLYLAYAFTDSTGVWGAAKVTPARETAASRLHLCVGRKNYEYRVNGKNPEAKCPKGLLIPAAIVWESTRGVYPNAYSRQYPPPKRFTVALGPNDRAIALGPQGSSAPAVQGPGVLKEMSAIIRDAVNGPGAPKPNMSARNRDFIPPSLRATFRCAKGVVERSAVRKGAGFESRPPAIRGIPPISRRRRCGWLRWHREAGRPGNGRGG